MKTTQKIIVATLLFAQALVGMSCNNDDDTQDPIIGKWQLEQIFTGDVSDDISNCQKESTLEFKADGTYVEINSDKASFDTECFTTTFDTDLFWENSGNNTYTFTDTGDVFKVDVTFIDGKLRLSTSEDGENVAGVYMRID